MRSFLVRSFNCLAMATNGRRDTEAKAILEPRMTRSRRKRQAESTVTEQKEPKTVTKVKTEPPAKEKNSVDSNPSKPKIKKIVKEKPVTAGKDIQKIKNTAKRKTRGGEKKPKDEVLVNGVGSENEKKEIKVKLENKAASGRSSEEMAGLVAKGRKFVGAHTSAAGKHFLFLREFTTCIFVRVLCCTF